MKRNGRLLDGRTWDEMPLTPCSANGGHMARIS